MFSFVGKIFSYFSYDRQKEFYQKKFEEELNNFETDICKENAEKQTFASLEKETRENDISDKKCYRRTGVITSMNSNGGVIDRTIPFDILTVNENKVGDLSVGYQVEYLAYKLPESEYIKVVKILQIIHEYWDDNPSDILVDQKVDELREMDSQYFKTHQRNILGQITSRNDNFITVDTDYDQLNVDLDGVSLEYVPQTGDIIYLLCNMQTDEEFVDSAGEILDVISLRPSRIKNADAKVIKVFDTWGVLEDGCAFNFDVLSSGYRPTIGDKVHAEMIECSLGEYLWRCTKVSPLELVAKEVVNHVNNSFNFDLFSNKNGIVITDDLKMKLDNIYDKKILEFVVENKGDRMHKVLRSAFMGKKSQSQLRLIQPDVRDSFFLNPGESRSYVLEVQGQFFGISTEVLTISFGGGFKIGRKIEIQVGEDCGERNKENKTVSYDFKRSSQYTNQVWSKKYNIIPGTAVCGKPKFIANRIGMYDVPERLRIAVLTAHDRVKMVEDIENILPSLGQELNATNYVHRFGALLHIEEIEYFISIRKYDQERAHFTKEKEYLALEIENLAEKRPSLVIGDSLRAINPWSEEKYSNRAYEGIIHKVLYNRILLKFNSGFHSSYNGEDYKLEFFFSRSGFRKQHYAIKRAVQIFGRDYLFPTKMQLHKSVQLNVDFDEDNKLRVKDKMEEIEWFNSSLNVVQKIAIKNVLRGEARPLPYVIFGPPGTGKTVTIIEIILQIVALVPNARILVGTPSNSSADLIATRLISSCALKPGDFVRLVSQNLVEKDLIPDHLKQYCSTIDIARDGSCKDNMIVTQSGLKLKCQVKHLGRHKITIGTCMTLGNLMQMSFPEGHFTHAIIDEVGQCLEPEVMTVLTQIDNICGQVVLAGDPMQLGPIVLQKYAAQKGLEVSFLVRLLEFAPYKKDRERFKETGYDPRLVTKLIYNYRSLPSILKMYNDLFYDGELQPTIAEKDNDEIELLKSLEDVLPPSENRPCSHGVFFVGIRGENRQDPDSPSWYNPAEVKSVFLFVLKLYQKKIKPHSIGIITPYQKQVRSIRNIFTEAGMVLPKIGTVEEFQGQERDVILISTVRSNKNLIQTDLKFTLGFVQSSKRMNVAISRSKACLVVFGNPHLLSMDPCWFQLIKYCIENEAYIGCDLPHTLQEYS